jgi:hypothetical protein
MSPSFREKSFISCTHTVIEQEVELMKDEGVKQDSFSLLFPFLLLILFSLSCLSFQSPIYCISFFFEVLGILTPSNSGLFKENKYLRAHMA